MIKKYLYSAIISICLLAQSSRAMKEPGPAQVTAIKEIRDKIFFALNPHFFRYICPFISKEFNVYANEYRENTHLEYKPRHKKICAVLKKSLIIELEFSADMLSELVESHENHNANTFSELEDTVKKFPFFNDEYSDYLLKNLAYIVACSRNSKVLDLTIAIPEIESFYICDFFAQVGDLEMLEYAHNKGCDWSTTTSYYAAAAGHFDCLKYAHENGCPWNKAVLCIPISLNGDLSCLKYAHEEMGCDLSSSACDDAAKGGYLDCLIYAHEHGCPLKDTTAFSAANGGHLDCLKYVHEHGGRWNASVPWMAARKGHLDCLKYAHQHGCEWNDSTCHDARKGGHLDCLNYARENGCPDFEP